MTLKDIQTGPDWVGWLVVGIFLLLAIILLSGHGAMLIAGYNTASKEEKSLYDARKLCRIMGCGMLVIVVMLFIMMLWQAVLPAAFAYVFVGVAIADVVAMCVLGNKFGRKK